MDTSELVISPMGSQIINKTTIVGTTSQEIILKGTVRERRKLYARLDQLSADDKEAFLHKVPTIVEAILGKGNYYMHYSAAKCLARLSVLEQSNQITEQFIGLLMHDIQIQISQFQRMRYDFVDSTFDKIFSPHLSLRTIQQSLQDLIKIRNTNYYARLQAECWISSNTGKRWLFWEIDQVTKQAIFVSKDLSRELRAIYRYEPETKTRTYCPVDEPTSDWKALSSEKMETNEKLLYLHDQPIDLHEMIELCNEKLFSEEKRLHGLFLDYVGLDKSMERTATISCCYPELGANLPVPGYIFQLRNPPRKPCNHGVTRCSLECSQMFEIRGINDELQHLYPYYFYKCTELESYHRCFSDLLGHMRGAFQRPSLGFVDYKNLDEYQELFDFTLSWHDEVFIFLVIPNICEKDSEHPLILLDHPLNYRNGEKILCFDICKNIYEVKAETVDQVLESTRVDQQLFVEMRSMWMRRKLKDLDGIALPSQDDLLSCRFFKYEEIKMSRQRRLATFRPLEQRHSLVLYEYPEEKTQAMPRWPWEIE